MKSAKLMECFIIASLSVLSFFRSGCDCRRENIFAPERDPIDAL